MLKADSQHIEEVVKFFNFELLVDGERPFYTDDRMLVESTTLEKKVYRNGKRRTVKVPQTSIHSTTGEIILETISEKDFKIGKEKPIPNQFIPFVVNQWETFLTANQRQFIKDMLDGNEQAYSKQLRHKYRTNIQKRLKVAFIGVGGDEVSIYRAGEFRVKLDTIRKFEEVAEDNEMFEQELLDNLDKEYVSSIVYDRMSQRSRRSIIACYSGKTERVDRSALYEFYDCLMTDKDMFELMNLS